MVCSMAVVVILIYISIVVCILTMIIMLAALVGAVELPRHKVAVDSTIIWRWRRAYHFSTSCLSGRGAVGPPAPGRALLVQEDVRPSGTAPIANMDLTTRGRCMVA